MSWTQCGSWPTRCSSATPLTCEEEEGWVRRGKKGGKRRSGRVGDVKWERGEETGGAGMMWGGRKGK